MNQPQPIHLHLYISFIPLLQIHLPQSTVSYPKWSGCCDKEQCSIMEPVDNFTLSLNSLSSSSRIQCCICYNIVYRPYDLCHPFCLGCLRKCIKKKKLVACPVCRFEYRIDKLTESKSKGSEIASTKVKCRFAEEGCDWSGNVGHEGRNFSEHVQQCGWACPHCTEVMIKDNIKTHPITCSKRVIVCTLCQHQFYLNQLQTHFQTGLCSNMKLCSNLNCKSHYLKEEIDGGEQHRQHQTVCEHELIDCSCCKIKVKRNEFNAHIMKELNSHLVPLLAAANQNSNSYVQQQTIDFMDRYSNLNVSEFSIVVRKSNRSNLGVLFSNEGENLTDGWSCRIHVTSFEAITGPTVAFILEKSNNSCAKATTSLFSLIIKIGDYNYKIDNQKCQVVNDRLYFQHTFSFPSCYKSKNQNEFGIKFFLITHENPDQTDLFIRKAKIQIAATQNKKITINQTKPEHSNSTLPSEPDSSTFTSFSGKHSLFDSIRPMFETFIHSYMLTGLTDTEESFATQTNRLVGKPHHKNRVDDETENEQRSAKKQRMVAELTKPN